MSQAVCLTPPEPSGSVAKSASFRRVPGAPLRAARLQLLLGLLGLRDRCGSAGSRALAGSTVQMPLALAVARHQASVEPEVAMRNDRGAKLCEYTMLHSAALYARVGNWSDFRRPRTSLRAACLAGRAHPAHQGRPLRVTRAFGLGRRLRVRTRSALDGNALGLAYEKATKYREAPAMMSISAP